MIRCIVAHKWSDVLQDFIPVPLDEADSWVIELNRRFAGSTQSPEEVAELLEREGFWDRQLPVGG